MKERPALFSATGIPSLFLIFAVLILVTLSLLGYGTARQDLSSSTLSLEQTTAYYQSCDAATDFYADAVQNLKSIQALASDPEEYFQLAGSYFSKLPGATWDADTHKVQYMQAFSHTQSLLVELYIPSYSEADTNLGDAAFADILTWKTIVTADWEPDTSQSVYKGE